MQYAPIQVYQGSKGTKSTADSLYTKNRKLKKILKKDRKIILKNRLNRVIPLPKTFKMRYNMPMFEKRKIFLRFANLNYFKIHFLGKLGRN